MQLHSQYYSNSSNTSALNPETIPDKPEALNPLFSSSFYKHLIADLQDEALAWRVSYELGGSRIYVPKNANKSNAFKDFGTVFCNWISKNYGGEQVVFPLGPAGELKRRSMQAVNLAKRGYSSNEIARQLGYSYRSAQYKKAIAKNNVQLSLFEQNNQNN